MQINKGSNLTRAVRVINTVDSSAIRVETDEAGDNVIVIPSYTLPADVVMNGGIYPEAEIKASFNTLEGTPAPLGHPYDKDGNPVSATSEVGLNRHYIGAINKNLKWEGNRVYLEKHINERVANQSENGRRFLEVVNQIMEGKRKTPIHTSTGLGLTRFMLPKPQVNAQGKRYFWEARNMSFDHDAILLDEDGAATPDEGVGMLVNEQGLLVPIDVFLENNQFESMNELQERLYTTIAQEFDDAWMCDWTQNELIFQQDDKKYKISYIVKDDQIQLVGEKSQVEKRTTWVDVAASALSSVVNKLLNNKGDGMALRELIDNALKQKGVDIANMSDEDKLKAYQQLNMDKSKDDESEDEDEAEGKKKAKPFAKASNSDEPTDIDAIAAAVAASVMEQVNSKLDPILDANKAREEEERSALISNAKTCLDLSDEELKSIETNTLRKLVEKNTPSFGYLGASAQNNSTDSASAVDQLPE